MVNRYTTYRNDQTKLKIFASCSKGDQISRKECFPPGIWISSRRELLFKERICSHGQHSKLFGKKDRSKVERKTIVTQTYIYAPAYSKNSGWALSITPVRPVRLSVCPSVCLSVRLSVPLHVRAKTPKPYGIYSWTFTGAYITLRRCVMNKEDNSCIFGFWIISAWLSSI